MKTAQKDVFATPRRASEIAPASDLISLEEIAGRDLLLHAATPAISSRFGEDRQGWKVLLSEPGSPDTTFEAMVFGVVSAAQIGKIMQDGGESLPLILRFEKSGRAWVIV